MQQESDNECFQEDISGRQKSHLRACGGLHISEKYTSEFKNIERNVTACAPTHLSSPPPQPHAYSLAFTCHTDVPSSLPLVIAEILCPKQPLLGANDFLTQTPFGSRHSSPAVLWGAPWFPPHHSCQGQVKTSVYKQLLSEHHKLQFAMNKRQYKQQQTSIILPPTWPSFSCLMLSRCQDLISGMLTALDSTSESESNLAGSCAYSQLSRAGYGAPASSNKHVSLQTAKLPVSHLTVNPTGIFKFWGDFP